MTTITHPAESLVNKPHHRENGIVKLVIAAPEQDGIAMFRRIQSRLHARLDMGGDADLDIPHAALREAPVVIFGESLDALGTGCAYFVFALVADEERNHKLLAIDRGIEHQIPALARLLNQPADDLHTPSFVITESARGLGIKGEVRHLADDDAMTQAIAHAMDCASRPGLHWRPHTEIPNGPETAIIAIRPPKDEPNDVDAILLAEVHRYNTRYACWMGESNGLKIKHDVYWWLPGDALLETLP